MLSSIQRATESAEKPASQAYVPNPLAKVAHRPLPTRRRQRHFRQAARIQRGARTRCSTLWLWSRNEKHAARSIRKGREEGRQGPEERPCHGQEEEEAQEEG